MNGNGNKPGNIRSRFAKEYTVDLNGTQAAIRAGYSEKSAHVTACRLLKDAKVQAAIQKEIAKRSQRTEITQDFVLNGLKALTLKCEATVPILDKKGLLVGARIAEPNAAVRGYELLGKHLKLFTDKVEHSGNMSNLSDEEVDAKLEALLEARSGGSA